jgi:hypothetical protein
MTGPFLGDSARGIFMDFQGPRNHYTRVGARRPLFVDPCVGADTGGHCVNLEYIGGGDETAAFTSV